MLHAMYKMKDPIIDLIESLLNIFYMFGIRIWYDKNHETDEIGIKCKNCKKFIGYEIQNKPFNKVITLFVVKIVSQNIGHAWIVDYNDNLKCHAQEICTHWMCDGPWYNPTI